MTGPETFQFAAAVAGVSIGLAAVLILAVFATVGTWRLSRNASDALVATSRAALTVEDLARKVAQAAPSGPADGERAAELRQQTEALVEQQRRLQEIGRDLLDTVGEEGGPAPAALDEIGAAVTRLDATVGQMATSLANLIQLLERQQERRQL